MHASYSERFGDEFLDNEFTTFRKFCKWLAAYPDVTIFVEIKQESIDRFDIPVFMDEVYKRILKSGVESQCIIISFNSEVVEYTRKISAMRTGWVLPRWNEDIKNELEELKPEFVFCDKLLLPTSDDDIWQGSWQWAIYNLDDVPSAITDYFANALRISVNNFTSSEGSASSSSASFSNASFALFKFLMMMNKTNATITNVRIALMKTP